MKNIKKLFLFLLTIFSNATLAMEDKDQVHAGLILKIFEAIRYNKLDEFKKLINLIDLKTKYNSEGANLLMKAVYEWASHEILELLLNKGIDINEQNYKGETALMYAIWQGNFGAVKLLLEKGANLELCDYERKTSIMHAFLCNNSKVNIIELLIKNGANLKVNNKSGESLLRLVIKNNGLNAVQFLISKNIYDINDINEKDESGSTALCDAINFNKNKDVVEVLIKAGANVNNKSKYGFSPLYWASDQKKELVELLINNGAEINITDNGGVTSLMNSVRKNKTEIIEVLLNLGANIFLKDKNNKTALDYAKESKNKEVKKLFINKLKLVLFDAINMGDYNKVKNLLIIIPLSVYDNNKNNPLHIASQINNYKKKSEIFKLLLSIKPSLISEVNNLGLTPLHINPAIINDLK